MERRRREIVTRERNAWRRSSRERGREIRVLGGCGGDWSGREEEICDLLAVTFPDGKLGVEKESYLKLLDWLEGVAKLLGKVFVLWVDGVQDIYWPGVLGFVETAEYLSSLGARICCKVDRPRHLPAGTYLPRYLTCR